MIQIRIPIIMLDNCSPVSTVAQWTMFRRLESPVARHRWLTVAPGDLRNLIRAKSTSHIRS